MSYRDSRDREKRRKPSGRERQKVERPFRGEETEELTDQFDTLSLGPQLAITSATVQSQVDTVWTSVRCFSYRVSFQRLLILPSFF